MQPLVSKSAEERSIERASAKLLRLLRKQPRKLIGRQLYPRDLQNTAIAMKKSGKRVHGDMNLLVFEKHSTMWRDLPPQREQERRATEQLGEISLGRTDVDLTRTRVCSEVRDGGPFRVGACKCSASERDEFNRMYGEKRFGGHGFRVFREMLQEAPQALTRVERDVLLSYSAHRPEAVAPLVVVERLQQLACDAGLYFQGCECWQGGSRAVCFCSEAASCGMLQSIAAWCCCGFFGEGGP